ncbi:MAG: phosphate uptake regulator PhoU [Ignisphaera sp.]|uniref:Phosphate uptake regulator PhoU n=1 Tax=Ignisphaera aggregans TaxID=334771 RepID=A0A7J3MX93_9CREN
MNSTKIVETRRVQKFGKSTLMISLPAEWVKFVNLKPSDMVRLESKEDGSLIIIPQSILEQKAKGKEVRLIVSQTTPEDILLRSLYASYIAGYDRIIVENSEGILSPSHMQAIRSLVRLLIGSEIVDQTPGRVAIQIFVDINRYSLDALVSRVISTLKNMFNFLTLSIKNSSVDHLKEITELEVEMDRVYALAIRYVYVLSLLGSTPFITEYRALIKALEDVGDALTQASSIFIDKPHLMNVVKMFIEDKLDELNMHIQYLLDIILDTMTKNNVYVASRAIDLAQESSKFIARMEMDVIPKYKSIDDYLNAKAFFERLQLICYNLQAATEMIFDIVVGKQGNVVNLVSDSG